MTLVLESQTDFTLDISAVDRQSPAAARTFVTEQLGEVLNFPDLDEVAYLANLAASELVTNVLRHAAGAARLTLTLLERAVEIAVADQYSGAFPDPAALAEADPNDEHHRGLVLLHQITDGVSVRAAAGWAKEVAVHIPLPVNRDAE